MWFGRIITICGYDGDRLALMHDEVLSSNSDVHHFAEFNSVWVQRYEKGDWVNPHQDPATLLDTTIIAVFGKFKGMRLWWLMVIRIDDDSAYGDDDGDGNDGDGWLPLVDGVDGGHDLDDIMIDGGMTVLCRSSDTNRGCQNHRLPWWRVCTA